MQAIEDASRVVLVGVGATAVMDIWLLLLKQVGVPTTNFALIGRWVGHLAAGRVMHTSMAQAPPIGGERSLGWLTHYAVGVVFAALLVGLLGVHWLQQPTLLPALAFGVATVALPLFVMQPAMGLGVAGTRTPAPLKNTLRSLANHAVFGGGMYLTAMLANWVSR